MYVWVWETVCIVYLCESVCVCECVLYVCEETILCERVCVYVYLWESDRWQTEKVFAWNLWNPPYSKFSNSYLIDFCSIRQILLWKLTSSRLLASQGWPARCSRKWLPPTAQASLITDDGTRMETWTRSWASSAMFPARSQAWHWRCAVLTACLKLSVLRFKHSLCLYTEISVKGLFCFIFRGWWWEYLEYCVAVLKETLKGVKLEDFTGPIRFCLHPAFCHLEISKTTVFLVAMAILHIEIFFIT